MNNEILNIKEDWVECVLEDLLVFMTNGSSAKQFTEKVGYPISRIETIWNEKIDYDRVKYIKESDLEFIEKYRVIKNDILLSHINSDSHLGKTAIFKDDKKVLIHGINLLKLRPVEGINAGFLLHQFRFKKVKGDFIDTAQRAVNQSSINQRKLKTFEFILAPLPIQRAIVSKIESLFSDLENGIANLKKAQEQLKIYRQAVLKKAFEGELTKEWRNNYELGITNEKLPRADELLEQIKGERKANYELQITNWKKAVKAWEKSGKEGKKPTKPKAIKELPPLTEDELKALQELPNGWQWLKLGKLTIKLSDGPFGSNLKSIDYVDEGIRVIRLENIKNLLFDNSKKSFVTLEKYNSISNHTVYSGDIIFSTFIAEETKVSIIPSFIDFAINKADCVCVRPYSNVNNRYLEYFLSTRFTYSQLVNQIHGATRPRINTTQLKSTPISLCSRTEQNQIVQEIESRLSVTDNLESVIRNSLLKAEALRQSILKKAFEGKLLCKAEIEACKQDADYEPASVLLQKITNEKLRIMKQSKQRKTRNS